MPGSRVLSERIAIHDGIALTLEVNGLIQTLLTAQTTVEIDLVFAGRSLYLAIEDPMESLGRTG